MERDATKGSACTQIYTVAKVKPQNGAAEYSDC